MKINDILLEDYEDDGFIDDDEEIVIEDKHVEMIYNSEFFRTNLYEKLDNIDELNETEFLDLKLPMLYHQGKLPHLSTAEIHQKRTPTDSNTIVHEHINALTKEKFGLPLRSILFGAKSIDYMYEVMAINEVNIYAIFPLDEYELYYNPDVRDLTQDFGLGFGFGHEVTLDTRFALELIENLEKKYGKNNKDLFDMLRAIIQKRFRMRKSEFYNVENESDIKELLGKFYDSDIKGYLKEEGLEDVRDDFIKLGVQSFYEVVDSIAKRYLKGIKKTKNLNDIPWYTEIMIDTKNIFSAYVPENEAMMELIRRLHKMVKERK